MRARAFAIGLALTSPVAADPPSFELNQRLPRRPFLMIEAPRRFLPGEAAFLEVIRRPDAPLALALYRLHAPVPLVERPAGPVGGSVASDPIGLEAEALLQPLEALPRHGDRLDLLLARRVPANRRQTTFGRRHEQVALGELPAGLYLARVHAGGWAASVVVTVSALTALVRRGDARDVVLVTDGDGVPQADVTVSRVADGASAEATRTSATGEASFPASDAVQARFVATRGDDVAWADAAWARGDACDVRVYVATAQPLYREGDRVLLRGHARGCVDEVDVPLRDEPVALRAGEAVATVRTDPDGNFVAALPAAAVLVATVRGREHVRTLAIDNHPRPLTPLRMRFDRESALPGEHVTVTVSDDRGGFPLVGLVRLDGDGIAVQEAPVGPGCAATFRVRVPDAAAAGTRLRLHAVVAPVDPRVVVDGTLPLGPPGPTEVSPGRAVSSAEALPLPEGTLLAVGPSQPFVESGNSVSVALRAPSSGATWLSLERRGVWSSRLVRADDRRPIGLDVPAGARGAATIVATHIQGGTVTTSSDPLGVSTPRPFALSVRSERGTYAVGATARVTIDARTREGIGRDAVVSLWVSDAGWWDDGEDTHPSPEAWFRLPAERAGAGDSATPDALGSEEGRRYDPVLRWNGRPLPRASFRHMWASASEPVTLDASGDLGEVATRLATAAGYGRAAVCAAAVRRAGVVRLEVREVPWPIAVARVAERSGTIPSAAGDTLRFDCPSREGTIGMGNIGTMGHGSGFGSGRGYRSGALAEAHSREATAFALGLRRLGASGQTTVDVALPAVPGRWRVEVVAIADDGAGARAHAELTTR